MKRKTDLGLYMIAMAGLMAALVFVGSKIEIRIPAVLGVTRVHLGNSMCLLSGFLLGAVPGGIAAGLGSFLFDMIFWPQGTPVEWLVTFATKFAMGFLAGLLMKKDPLHGLRPVVRYAVYGASGALLYIFLYLLQSFITYRFVLGNPLEAVWLMVLEKGAAALFNGVIAVVISVPIYMALWPKLRKGGLI